MTSREIVQTGAVRQVYETGVRCPGCWGKSWIVGRVSAECGRCGHALPLLSSKTVPGA